MCTFSLFFFSRTPNIRSSKEWVVNKGPCSQYIVPFRHSAACDSYRVSWVDKF